MHCSVGIVRKGNQCAVWTEDQSRVGDEDLRGELWPVLLEVRRDGVLLVQQGAIERAHDDAESLVVVADQRRSANAARFVEDDPAVASRVDRRAEVAEILQHEVILLRGAHDLHRPVHIQDGEGPVPGPVSRQEHEW